MKSKQTTSKKFKNKFLKSSIKIVKNVLKFRKKILKSVTKSFKKVSKKVFFKVLKKLLKSFEKLKKVLKKVKKIFVQVFENKFKNVFETNSPKKVEKKFLKSCCCYHCEDPHSKKITFVIWKLVVSEKRFQTSHGNAKRLSFNFNSILIPLEVNTIRPDKPHHCWQLRDSYLGLSNHEQFTVKQLISSTRRRMSAIACQHAHLCAVSGSGEL